MAEEAILRVILEGQGGSSPRSPAGARPEREVRTPREKPEPAGKPLSQPQSVLQQLLDVFTRFRGTLGGLLGPVAGAALDLTRAFHETSAAARMAAEAMRPPTPEAGAAERLTRGMAPPTPAGAPATQALPGTLPSSQAGSLARTASAGPTGGLSINGIPLADYFGMPHMELPEAQARPAVPSAAALPAEHAIPTAQPVTAQEAQIAGLAGEGIGPGAAGVASVGTGPAGMGAALGAAGAVGVAYVAAVEATKAIRGLGEGAIKATGDLVSGLVSAKVGAADYASSLGAGAKKAADALVYVSPAAAIVVGAFGQVAESAGAVMKQFDAMASRYTGFAPGVAQAQAAAAVTHIAGEFRRGQEVGASLARYIQVRTELQEKFEDVKARFLAEIAPAVVTVMKDLEKYLPLIDAMAGGFGDILTAIAYLTDPVEWLRQHFDMKDRKMPVTMPTDQIMNAVGGNVFRPVGQEY